MFVLVRSHLFISHWIPIALAIISQESSSSGKRRQHAAEEDGRNVQCAMWKRSSFAFLIRPSKSASSVVTHSIRLALFIAHCDLPVVAVVGQRGGGPVQCRRTTSDISLPPNNNNVKINKYLLVLLLLLAGSMSHR